MMAFTLILERASELPLPIHSRSFVDVRELGPSGGNHKFKTTINQRCSVPLDPRDVATGMHQSNT